MEVAREGLEEGHEGRLVADEDGLEDGLVVGVDHEGDEVVRGVFHEEVVRHHALAQVHQPVPQVDPLHRLLLHLAQHRVEPRLLLQERPERRLVQPRVVVVV